jgi:archaellum component FlaC
MAPASDRDFLTHDQFLAARDKQDTALRAEFRNIHEQFAVIDERFTHVDEEFARVHEQFAIIDERFTHVDEEFARVHERFAVFDEKFDRIDERFARVDEKFDELKVDIRRNEALSHNSRLRNPINPIKPVPTYRLGRGLVMPVKFPQNPKAFLKLAQPTDHNRALLIYLIRFYDIHGHAAWAHDPGLDANDDDDDDYDNDNVDNGSSESGRESSGSESTMSLEEAVARYPDRALEALALILGLEIEHFLDLKRRASVMPALVAATKRSREPPAPRRPRKQFQVVQEPIAGRPRSEGEEPLEAVIWLNEEEFKKLPRLTLRHPHGTESDKSMQQPGSPAAQAAKSDADEGSPTNPFTSGSDLDARIRDQALAAPGSRS